MTRGDKLLILLVFVLAIISLVYIYKQGLSNDKKYASVQVNGEEVKRIIFDKKIIGREILIETKYGSNLLEVGDEEIRVIDASCPDKLDVRQGSISKIGEIITCLPNKMVIEIKGDRENTDNDIDIMNY